MLTLVLALGAQAQSVQTWEHTAPDDGFTPEVIDFEIDDSDPRGIVGGQQTSQFPQVVALGVVWGNRGQSFCSATLVHSEWLITAAHCVEAAYDYNRQGATVYAMFGGSAYNFDDAIAIDQLEMHPDYDPNRFAHDIGVAHLASPKKGIAPMAINDESINANWRGEELQMVGYGITSDNANDGGVKRTVTLQISQSDDQYVYSTDPVGTSNVCSGDSGGAALEMTDNGYELAGVNAFVTPGCVNGSNGATRVDSHLDFVQDHIPSLVYDAGDAAIPSDENGPKTEAEAPGAPDQDEPGNYNFDDAETPTGDEYRKGLACSNTGAPTAGWLALVALLGIRRR